MARRALAPLGALAALAAVAAGCRSEQGAVEACEPGETLVIGCAAACGIGSCEGDPVLRVCDGAIGLGECRRTTDPTLFESVDDSCGTTCPRMRVTCPASGSVAIVPRPLFEGSRWRCDFEVDHRGILPPGGRGAETVACSAGAPQVVACALGCGLGECEGGPSLRVCEGTASAADCRSGTAPTLPAQTSSPGCGGSCPYRLVVCPASGSLTVVPEATGAQICEWAVREAATRPDGTEVCSAGQRVVVGCAHECGNGSCEGEPYVRVCDGNDTPEECAAYMGSGWLGQGGESSCSSECAEVAVTCPGSGAVTVVTRDGWSSGAPHACDWRVRPAAFGE